jgi:hypothetical protein
VDPKLYVVLTTPDIFAAGSWTQTVATLQGFPSSGNWTLNYADDPGVQVQDTAGKDICTLLFLTPKSTARDGDALTTAGQSALFRSEVAHPVNGPTAARQPHSVVLEL